jgi:hypothetical protein
MSLLPISAAVLGASQLSGQKKSSPSDIASKLKKRRYSRLSGADAELAEGLNEGRTITSKVAGPVGSLAGGAVLHGPGSTLVGQMGRALFK